MSESSKSQTLRKMSEFGILKTTLSEYLPKDVCHKLCVYFDLKPATQETILQGTPVGLCLLDYLTESNIILPNDLTTLEEALQKLNLARALKKIQEYHQLIEKLEIIGQSDSEKKTYIYPVDVESEEEDDDNFHGDKSVTFEDFITSLNLRDKLNRKLRLSDFLTIKGKSNLSLVESFWQKLSSLDYRARSNSFLSSISLSLSKQISVKDFIFAIMHCSDSFLRQDIIEKLSACQLAVPVLLKGIGGKRVEYLTWSIRRIFKIWEEEDSIALEKAMFRFPVFSVAFLRIGDIKNFSKSTILNMLLGPCQGNVEHPYFLCKKDDPWSSGFSEGCVESVWYLPVSTNDLQKIKRVLLIFNLRGDSNFFPVQTKFLCQAANLTIAFIATRNQSGNDSIIEKIASVAPVFKFVAINDERITPPKKSRKLKWDGDWLFVRYLENNNLCHEICTLITDCQQNCSDVKIRSLEQMIDLCAPDIDVEDNKKAIQGAKSTVKDIVNPEETWNVTEYKNTSFPLQSLWREWVEVDKKILKPDIDSATTIDELRDDLWAKKDEVRKKQLSLGLSNTMEKFYTALENAIRDMDSCGYFVSYFQEQLLCLTNSNNEVHLKNIVRFKRELSNLSKIIESKRESSQSKENRETDIRLKKKWEDYNWLYKTETDQCRNNDIGIEHFLRELGQWYEAHAETVLDKGESRVPLLPVLAARLLVNGCQLELLDGATGCVPLSWVTSVLDQLYIDLKDPSIFVLSVIGVQSSGKSTLLNSMFGVRFPVSAGPCTRGVVLRLIHVEDGYAQKLGVKFIFLIDSEGVRSIERDTYEDCRFDNELVTLVLFISDLTILNIEGQNIGRDMMGLLEIAAHAMVRMKEVDLSSQCRIIQQKVSDPTAQEKNKQSSDLLINKLNAAISNASKKEGFGNRYTNIAEVLDIRLDEKFRFVPCLWTGIMSPPTQFYGDAIRKLKSDILEEIECHRVVPQFTIKTFTHRIRDVWRAVKSEHFLFYFEDSVEVIDFINLSKELNEWIIDMRTDINEKLSVWRKELATSKKQDITILTQLENQCRNELEAHRTKIHKLFESFVSQQKRQIIERKYDRKIMETLTKVFSDIERHVRSVLENDHRTNKLKHDISNLVEQVRQKMHEFVKQEKNYGPGTSKYKKSLHNSKVNLDETFSKIWEQCNQEMTWIDSHSQETSEQLIRVHCEDLLISVTREKVVSSDIEHLMKSEGGIQNHQIAPNWRKYYPCKGTEEYVENWFRLYEKSLQDIIDESVNEMKEKSSGKSFDANLFQLLLQRGLRNLSLRFQTAEPPYYLKGKVLLHISSRLFQVALQNQKIYEAKNSVQSLIEKEKATLYKEFIALCTEDTKTKNVCEYFKSLFIDWLRDSILNGVKKEMLFYFTRNVNLADKCFLNRIILFHLAGKESPEEYLEYLQNHKQYVKKWVNREIVDHCTTQKYNGKTCMQFMLEKVLNSNLQGFITIVTNILKTDCDSADEGSNIKRVSMFLEELNKRGFMRQIELRTFLCNCNISETNNLLTELQSYIKGNLADDMIQECDIPMHKNADNVKTFILKKLFSDPSDSLLEGVCLEQCPMCKAACENNWQRGSYHEHMCSTHIPRGMGGIISQKTKQLMLHDCVSCVASDKASYQISRDGVKYFCKDYKTVSPSWSIKPITPINYGKYWKWVMVRLNEPLAKIYKCKPAAIPPSWRQITKNAAIENLRSAMVTSLPGAPPNVITPEFAL